MKTILRSSVPRQRWRTAGLVCARIGGDGFNPAEQG
jgi:hypothetical protein